MDNQTFMEKKQTDEWLNDLPLAAENIAFKSEEMIACAKCARTNSPNRLKCFYCGGELAITEAQSQLIKPNLRKLEAWEKGFNLIYQSSDDFDEAKMSEAIRLLKLETEVLHKIFENGAPLPLARAESEKEAEITRTRLREIGVESRLLSDELLAVEKTTRRLRGIEFFDDKLILILFNRDEIVEVAVEDLALIVPGAVFERRIEATEKRSRKGENKILDSSETASDETLLDIYSRQDSIGFRIYAKGFDFSSLESEKTLLAKDNIGILAEKLRRIAPNAKLVNDYLKNRGVLASVWEVEQKTESQGLKRESFGKFNIGNLTTVNNLSQFTRYSRLQWHLL